jgi:hypothetical protein
MKSVKTRVKTLTKTLEDDDSTFPQNIGKQLTTGCGVIYQKSGILIYTAVKISKFSLKVTSYPLNAVPSALSGSSHPQIRQASAYRAVVNAFTRNTN